jgi:hypothetical protein
VTLLTDGTGMYSLICAPTGALKAIPARQQLLNLLISTDLYSKKLREHPHKVILLFILEKSQRSL